MKPLQEFDLIQNIISKLHSEKKVVVGPGDDAAHVKRAQGDLLVTTDMLIENVHFRRDWMSDWQVGFKAMRVNISDIAAMGGIPRYAVVALGVPQKTKSQNIVALMKGLDAAAHEAGVVIIGGDTNAVPAGAPWVVSVTVLGEKSGRVLTRAGACVGDAIYVTGYLGESALGLYLLNCHRERSVAISRDAKKLINHHITPPNRVRIGQKLARMKGVHSLMDLSDGLMGDLQHILDASQVSAQICIDDVPLSKPYKACCQKLGLDPLTLALSGGEDYELLLTVSPRVKMPDKIDGIPLKKLGKIVKSSSKKQVIELKDAFGGSVKSQAVSYQHSF